MRAIYYTALTDEAEYSSIRPVIDWLDCNGYTVVTRTAKEFTDELAQRKLKSNMNTEIAVDIMETSHALDHVVSFSGDGDFRYLTETVQRTGVRVSLVSTVATKPPGPRRATPSGD
ncbi:MAG: NYN domain-containing protein [Hyphomicrobiales bacterium]